MTEVFQSYTSQERTFSQAPFWFWNDDLSETEIVRQLEDFQAHGVHAFVIHPRAGLPRHLGWMSDGLLRTMRFAIEAAARRDMWVILYDEAMYPSGSSAGQVVFTDEPSLLGKRRPGGTDPRPGTTGILEHVNALLGYDFTPHLPALWDDAEPDYDRYRKDYERAIAQRLQETYYQPISDWCSTHGIALTGHPGKSDDIGMLRHFHIPGQDVVLRYIEPGKASALVGSWNPMGVSSWPGR